MEYLDFEIEIGQGQGREYPVAVIRSPAGEARETMTFPFGDQALQNHLQAMETALGRSGASKRQALKTVQDFGRDLFNALIGGEIRSRFDVSRLQVQQQHRGLRVKLRFQTPELAALPWEFLFDERRREYLCLSKDTPPIRYLELPQPILPLTVTPPLRVLGMVASPSDLPKLDEEREKQRIETAFKHLRDAGVLEFEWLPGQSWRHLQQAMRRGPWHIFHFIGHGGFDYSCDEGYVDLVNDTGHKHPLRATQLASLLAGHHALRLVLLNTCEGAKGSGRDIFSSTAAILVHSGVAAVLAMQNKITDQAALEFSRVFYEALADGLPVDASVTEARIAVNIAFQETLEWGTPVLYMRSQDGVLFEFVQHKEAYPLGEPVPQIPEKPSPEKESETSPTQTLMAKRFFISYKRKVCDDNTLAHFLHDGLKEAGHEVFIDTGIPVGANWAAEIERRLDWCDFLVVLLSEESVASEMVQGEVRLARDRRRPDGRPHILPIRVGFDGPLPYELDCYVGRLQYLFWTRPDDSQGILDTLKTAVAAGVEAETPGPQPPAAAGTGAAQEPHRPQASVDPRCFLRRPGGTMKPADPFYISRPQDTTIAEIAELSGETLVIKAPRQMGKSSLLWRYLGLSEAAGKRWAFVDFQCFSNTDFADYLIFLKQLAAALARSLEIDDRGIPAFASQQSFSYFVEDHLIRGAGGPLVLAFDEVERMLGRSYQGDFFSLLRSWHNQRSKPRSPWEEVDLALVISTEPYLLIDRSDQSPFNVTPPVELEPFSLAAVEELNRRYGGLLNPTEVTRLVELLGGHPYLTRLAFYRLTAGAGLTFPELLDRAAAEDGPFGEHLRRLHLLLQEHAGLAAALRQAIANGTVADEDHYHRLKSAGLIRRRNGRLVPANLLYASYFRGVR